LLLGVRRAGQNKKSAAELVEYFGPDRSLADIGHDDVLKLIHSRRKHRVGAANMVGPARAEMSAVLLKRQI
jgi:hypothetical protein